MFTVLDVVLLNIALLLTIVWIVLTIKEKERHDKIVRKYIAPTVRNHRRRPL